MKNNYPINYWIKFFVLNIFKRQEHFIFLLFTYSFFIDKTIFLYKKCFKHSLSIPLKYYFRPFSATLLKLYQKPLRTIKILCPTPRTRPGKLAASWYKQKAQY
jgi:hypothetical protein